MISELCVRPKTKDFYPSAASAFLQATLCTLTSTSLTSEATETYIEKDTGLFVKSTDGNTLTEKEYKFDNVEDTIFIEPDISEYTLKEKE